MQKLNAVEHFKTDVCAFCNAFTQNTLTCHFVDSFRKLIKIIKKKTCKNKYPKLNFLCAFELANWQSHKKFCVSLRHFLRIWYPFTILYIISISFLAEEYLQWNRQKIYVVCCVHKHRKRARGLLLCYHNLTLYTPSIGEDYYLKGTNSKVQTRQRRFMSWQWWYRCVKCNVTRTL